MFFHPNSYGLFCVKYNEDWIIVWNVFVACIITLITIIVCIVLIVSLMKIKIEDSNDALMKSKKENIKLIISYCVGNLILTFQTIVLIIAIQYFDIYLWFDTISSLFIFLFYYLFIWNKEVKDALLSLCMCAQRNDNSLDKDGENGVNMLNEMNISSD